MSDKPNPPTTIDAYIAAYPDDIQAILRAVRATVRAAAPETEETIKYGIPTFMLHGRNLVYFAAHKRHIGFYPAPVGEAAFKDELARYESGRGTLQFPYDEPLPHDFITRVVGYWAERNRQKAEAKQKR